MKKAILSVLFIGALAVIAKAQDDEEKEKGFKKENLFTGGSLTASFYSGGTVLGINPFFGYKLADFADAGIAVNYTYSGSRDLYILNDKLRQHVYGGGVFTRLYPAKFLFLQGQFEHNFMSQRYTQATGSPVQSFKQEANSLLVGAGLAQGRERGSTNFFYISLLVDVLGNVNSPYVDPVYNDQGQLVRVDKVPVFRAGINIGLFQKRYNR